MGHKGTTVKTGMAMKAASQSARPATSGNKRVTTSARRMSAAGQMGSVAGTIRSTHTGPFSGN